MAREYPKPMYHRTEAKSILALNKDHELKLNAEGYQTKYTYKEYPKFLFHEIEADRQVFNKEQETALLAQKGWSLTPVPKRAPALTPVDVIRNSGQMDADTFQRLQKMEFEVGLLKEQMQNLIGECAETKRRCAEIMEVVTGSGAVV